MYSGEKGIVFVNFAVFYDVPLGQTFHASKLILKKENKLPEVDGAMNDITEILKILSKDVELIDMGENL